jgi:arginine/lysine/ornithine decarboxylase
VSNEIAPHTRPQRVDVDQLSSGSGIQTPFADEVLRLRRTASGGEPIVSFHALPWGQGRSLVGGGAIGAKYRQLFGEAFLDSEVTYSAGVLDSYFHPNASLDLAQHLAAEAFRADYTFFITCGTSIANQVAFDALADTNQRILIDRTAHQSIHIAAGQSSASVDYAPAAEQSSLAGQPLLDIAQLLEMVAAAAHSGTPYDTIVLAACSYDGVLYNLHRIISECLARSPATAFLIDEAWSAINTFHPDLRPLTALDAAHRIAAAGTPITVLVTQSAHKSMSAARQGSYLHVVGEPALITRVASTLYGRHTTSPSIPILASLDLARAHAQVHGQRLLQRSLDLAAHARQVIVEDPALAAYAVVSDLTFDAGSREFVSADPTKLLIDITVLGRSGEDVRLRLFHDYGIYVSRTLPAAFLVSFHIGIAAQDVDRLLQSLRFLAHRTRRRPGGTRAHFGTDVDGTPIDRLLIAYPPGVPLAVPGELWTHTLRQRVAASRRSGAQGYRLPTAPSHPHAHTA